MKRDISHPLLWPLCFYRFLFFLVLILWSIVGSAQCVSTIQLLLSADQRFGLNKILPGNGWAILFSHPKDFTPVCTTELGFMAKLEPEFTNRNCKVIGLSVDPVESHSRWKGDIEETQGYAVNYPMIGDPTLAIAKLYDMLPAEEPGTSEGRTAATNQTVRTVFVIGPDKKIKLHLTYPMSTGRNFYEILRVLDSMQLTAAHKVATPANWEKGDDVIILASVSEEEAKEKYPNGWKAPKPYLRIVPQPV